MKDLHITYVKYANYVYMVHYMVISCTVIPSHLTDDVIDCSN